MKRLVIFASGSGSNTENIIRYFENSRDVEVSLVLTNNPNARVLERAKNLGVASICFNRKAFSGSSIILELLKNLRPDLIVLAGFLWKVPAPVVEAFSNKMINIHPALLPKFGGKGMYGIHVHEAVVAHKESESGITIHYVNEHYDEGSIVFQAKCVVLPTDSATDVAKKIHKLEMAHFPKVIEDLLTS
jgi:phosphoribosylglycinamide formyltransferase-1